MQRLLDPLEVIRLPTNYGGVFPRSFAARTPEAKARAIAVQNQMGVYPLSENQSGQRKFDCEAWLPSQGRYLEVTSTSNCTTFQARRLDIRERIPGADSGTRPVATLNGTLATTRWIVPILENHQQADGSVRVPEALRPYLGGLDVLSPAG